jgi:serine/threonine protein kinase
MEKSGSYGDELPPGAELCAGQYVIERYLNSGGFGVTYLARDSLGRSVVIKECFPSAMCHRSG